MLGGFFFTGVGGMAIQDDKDYIVFAILALLGLVILIMAIRLDPELEESNEKVIKLSCC